MSIQVDRPSAVIIILYEISKRGAQTYRIVKSAGDRLKVK